MTTTTATKGNEIQIGRFLVTFCPADEDGPDGWEIRGTGEESEDVLDSYETKREAVKVAKDMEADRLQDEKDEREAEEIVRGMLIEFPESQKNQSDRSRNRSH